MQHNALARINVLQLAIWPLTAILATSAFGLLYKAATEEGKQVRLWPGLTELDYRPDNSRSRPGSAGHRPRPS